MLGLLTLLERTALEEGWCLYLHSGTPMLRAALGRLKISSQSGQCIRSGAAPSAVSRANNFVLANKPISGAVEHNKLRLPWTGSELELETRAGPRDALLEATDQGAPPSALVLP